MARPVTVRETYTRERSRLSRLEMAVEKDPRLGPEQKSKAAASIRGLVQVLMDLDSTLGLAPPLPADASAERGARSRRRAA
jgi:hypothetical protein